MLFVVICASVLIAFWCAFWFLLLVCILDIESRSSSLARPVHIINIDIPDNHEDAMLGAIVMCDLCEMVIIGFFQLDSPPSCIFTMSGHYAIDLFFTLGQSPDRSCMLTSGLFVTLLVVWLLLCFLINDILFTNAFQPRCQQQLFRSSLFKVVRCVQSWIPVTLSQSRTWWQGMESQSTVCTKQQQSNKQAN